MSVDSYLVIPVVEVIFCVGLLILLMVSGKRHIARRPFAIFLGFMALWGSMVFMMRLSGAMSAALIWERFVLASILSASIFFFRFTVTLTGSRPPKKILYSLYGAYFVILALIPTSLVVQDMQMMWYGKAPVIGVLFPIYVLCAYVPLVLSAMMLVRHIRHSRIIDERVRAQYIIIGMAAMFIGATTDYLPTLGINLYPLGIIGNIFFCVIATTAMLRHDLLEMKVVVRKLASYALTSLLVFGAFGSIIYLLSYLFRDFMSPVSLTLAMVAVFIAATIFQPVLTQLQKIVDRWFFKERYTHIQTLRRFTEETKGDLELTKLSTTLVTAVANGMDSQGVYLLLPEPVTGDFSTFSHAGRQSRGELGFTATSPLAVTMQQMHDVIDASDMDIIPSLISFTSGDRRIIDDNNIDLLVPIRNNGDLSGMLLLTRKISGEPYSHEERRLLKNAASDVAVNIRNASRYEDMKQNHNKMEKAIDGIIHAISLVVETRDPYTAGHQRRVAELARCIAREMELSEWQTMGIYIAGLLHDVGKVAVPSEILSKPGKINQYEFSIIKNHSQVGYDILQRIDFPWPVTQAILQHHERLDGSGYPGGLRDHDIIIEARILGVADVVEAMSSHRPYRPALGLNTALEEVSRASGTLYDRSVVNACLNLLEKNEPEFERIMAAATNSIDYTVTAAI